LKAVEVRVRRATRRIEIDYEGGETISLPAEYLRVESPSAEVQGHGPNERKLVAGKQEVGISAVDPIGNYAIRIRFDDGHDTGIYTWTYLHELGTQHAERWAQYLAALERAGQTRVANRYGWR